MKNEALNTLQALANCGAEFEDQNLALEIIEKNLAEAVNAKLQEAAEKLKRRYAIALVFRKDEGGSAKMLLRSLTTDANSEEEALGEALNYFKEETEGYYLGMKTVTSANNIKSILDLQIKDQ